MAAQVTMPSLQEQARALGDPTRYAIFRYIADAGAPADVPALTDHLGLNHNAIRQHLAKLLAAGLVEEAKAPRQGPGRPRLVYRVKPGVDSRWGVVGPYEQLSVLLAEVLRSGDTPEEVGRRYAHQSTLSSSASDPVERVEEAMASQGFAPEVRRNGSKVEVVLNTCPFASAALVDADTVCRIHLGMAEGLAELTGGEVIVDELVAHDPRPASCRLRLRVEAGQPDEEHEAHEAHAAHEEASIRFTRRKASSEGAKGTFGPGVVVRG